MNDWTKALSTSNNEAQLIPTQDPLEHLQDARKGLGLMDRLKLDWRGSGDIVEHIEGIATSLLKKQRASMEHQIMLDLDTEKKERFKTYLSEVQQVEKSIFASTEEAKSDLIRYMKEQQKGMFKEKMGDFKEIDDLLANGEIFPEDAEKLKNNSTEWTDKNFENIAQKLSILLTQHAEAYQQTLTLMKSKVLG